MPLINTVQEFDAALEYGPYAWPGGYPIYFVTNDGEALSFDAAKEGADLIRASISERVADGWRVIGSDINYEDEALFCAHTGERIPSAYA